jgi:hypothetical protein
MKNFQSNDGVLAVVWSIVLAYNGSRVRSKVHPRIRGLRRMERWGGIHERSRPDTGQFVQEYVEHWPLKQAFSRTRVDDRKITQRKMSNPHSATCTACTNKAYLGEVFKTRYRVNLCGEQRTQ